MSRGALVMSDAVTSARRDCKHRVSLQTVGRHHHMRRYYPTDDRYEEEVAEPDRIDFHNEFVLANVGNETHYVVLEGRV